MLLVIGFVFRYFWWWHLQISFNCSSNLVWSWSSPSSQFVEFNGIVRHFGGISIAKSMFSLDSSVGFHENASPCMKHVELLLRKFETSWFIFESTPFKYIISFSISFIVSHNFYHTWTWFRVLFWYIVVLLDPWVRVVGFLRFHRSSDFIWKRHCYQEARHFRHKVYTLFLFLLPYIFQQKLISSFSRMT